MAVEKVIQLDWEAPAAPVALERQLHMLLTQQLRIRLLLVQVALDMQAALVLQGQMAQILYSDHLHQPVAVVVAAVHRPELLVKQADLVVDGEAPTDVALERVLSKLGR